MNGKNWKASAALIFAAAAVVAGNGVAHAQQDAPLFAALPGAIDEAPVDLRVSRGERVTLPTRGATRIIAANDDVVRGLFSDGRPVLEGVATGTTLVEVYGRDNKRQLYSVQVEEPLTTARNAPQTVISQLPSANTREASRPRFAASDTPRNGAVVRPLPPAAGTPKVVTQQTPVVIAAGNAPITSRPAVPDASTRVVPARGGLVVSLRIAPAGDNSQHALCTITYRNGGASVARGVVVRTVIDEAVSYVKGSGTERPSYDGSARALSWNIGDLNAGESGRVVFRLEAVNRRPTKFPIVATIEDASGLSLTSNQVDYSFSSTSLLTVFALPDRFLAGRAGTPLSDVRGLEYQRAIDRLQTMGVVNGRPGGIYVPKAATQRAEYAVMTLKGLNLKDLRDATAIKFVLGRASIVTVRVLNSRNQVVETLVASKPYPVGEQTVVWDGRIGKGNGFAPPGRYIYECTARDRAQNETTTLRGQITVVPQTPLQPVGSSSFTDVSARDWFSGYLAVAEKQNLMIGYPDRTFRPRRSINRVEATAVVVRALGLEDVARRASVQDVGFLDEQNIPTWAKPHVYAATALARTQGGGMMKGYPSNFFLPMKSLNREEAALMVQRLIDRETNRRIAVSGAMVPGATVSINGRTVEADDEGKFSFVIEQNNAQPTTVAVIGPGM